MLYYVRESERKDILAYPSKSEVSQYLIDKFTREMEKLDKVYQRIDWYFGCDSVYMICEEIIIGWESFGIFPCLENIHEQPPLLENTNYRKLINVAKKMTVFEFIQQILSKLNSEIIESVLIYKVEFPNNSASNKNIEISFKPIDVLNRELLFNNSKKNPKKSIFYVKVIEKNKNPEESSIKIVSKINDKKYYELEESERQLHEFSLLQGINAFKPLEIQRFMFDKDSKEDDLNFVKLIVKSPIEFSEDDSKEESKDDFKDDSKDGNEANPIVIKDNSEEACKDMNLNSEELIMK